MTVYLVGAGPGDPGLITVRGHAILQIANVVIHDRLISLDLLRLARPDAVVINVGKSPDGHTATQDEINALLIEYGESVTTVARLKGGDPFVFGRGGEEVIALKAAGIPVEVVPGITSALAAPAYAGIPATQRDVSTAFTVVTGHEHPAKPSSTVDFAALARSQGLIFLMAVRQLPSIVSSLMQYGRAADTPVACVEWGTFPQQRTVSGTLMTIVDKARQEGLRSPAVIVIGEVAALAESMAWHKVSSMADKRIAAGTVSQNFPDLSAHLTALGAFVCPMPLDSDYFFAQREWLDMLIIASPDEAGLFDDPTLRPCPCRLVCCDNEAAALLRAADMPFVEIATETAGDFIAQLEAVFKS